MNKQMSESRRTNRGHRAKVGGAVAASLLAFVSLASLSFAEESGSRAKTKAKPVAAAPSSAVDLQRHVSSWPPRPRLAALEMMAKYGSPLEVSSEALVWHDAGPFKRVMVTKKEIPHDFPKPHMDFVEHTISYDVPTDKVDDLVAFDASITINKTAGEMSARCDLEGHNILTHNLANDIVRGKLTVANARKAFGQNVVDDVLGKHPPYIEKLQFEPPSKPTAFADKPIIPGSPQRAPAGAQDRGDAEVLATVIAIDENEVLAAMVASKKKVRQSVLDFATMMHAAHGKNAAMTMKLGQSMKTTPIDTDAVDAVRVKGAGELAAFISLDGKPFEVAYMDAMVKGHVEVLAMIDGQLVGAAKHEALKRHLAETRGHVAMHLAEAKKVRASL